MADIKMEQIVEFKTMLKLQVEMLEQFSIGQKELHDAVLGQDWAATEEAISACDLISSKLKILEERRHASYLEMTGGNYDSFMDFIGTLPEAYRQEMVEQYRLLKVVVLKNQHMARSLSRTAGNGISAYRQLFNRMYPERSGTMYGRGGNARHGAPSEGVVINHHL